MDKRKIILLFLASSTFSLMVFFIIYGLFIKDGNDELIKPAQTAPMLPSSQVVDNTPAPVTEPTKPIDVEIPKAEEPAVKEEPKTTEESTKESTTTTKEKPADKTAKTEKTAPVVVKIPTKPSDKPTDKTATVKPTTETKTTKTTTTATPKAVTSKAPLPRIEPDSPSAKPPVPKTTTSKAAALPLPPKPPTVSHSVYVRGFTSEKAAQDAATALQQNNPKNKAIVTHKNGQVVLQFGTFSDKTNADKLKQELKTQNINAQTD